MDLTPDVGTTARVAPTFAEICPGERSEEREETAKQIRYGRLSTA